MHAPLVGDSNMYRNNFSEENLFLFQSEAIKKAASEGSCVFVGRAADYILRDEPNAISIFITADIESRIENVSKRMGIDKMQLANLSKTKKMSALNTITTIQARSGDMLRATTSV